MSNADKISNIMDKVFQTVEDLTAVLTDAETELIKALPDAVVPPVVEPPVVVPPVVVPPVITPPATGSATVPTELENMKLVNGYYVAQAPFPTKAAVLHFDVKGLGFGKKLHVEFVRSMTGVGKGNEKTYRMWNGGVGNGPDFYFGTPDGNWVFGYFEYVNTDTDLHISAQMPPMDGKDHKETLDFVFPSRAGAADGSIVYKVDGNIIAVATKVQMDDANNPAVYNWHCIQFDTPNWDPSNASMKVKADSIRYVVS